MQLSGKKILLGVTGSIAAYKTAELVRLFVKEGADVKVVMTPASQDFTTPLTLSTVSKNPVYTKFINDANGTWTNHVELGLWADIFLVAPASANSIAKFANGICDNLLTAVYLSAKCPVFIAPAMDLDMLKHQSTQNNFSKLKKYGNQIIGPASGELASGLIGEGRMEEPELIFANILFELTRNEDFKGKKVLVTAGPTQEAIDPVRYISNHSSGKMGFAIAEEFARRGAKVVLVAGPGNLQPVHYNIKHVKIVSAAEMHKICLKEFPSSEITVMAAAVADFTPATQSKSKIKKANQTDASVIELKPTTDILSEMGAKKKKGQLLAGFALETNDEIENAEKKLKIKNLDFIVLNSMRDMGAGFNSETNKITIIEKNKKPAHYPLKSKAEVAADIVNKIKQLMK